MNKFIFSVIIILILSLVACADTFPAATNTIPTPEPDKSTIYGTLLSLDNEPLKDITVRLAQVYRFNDEEGTFILDEAQSPSTISQENGQFVFSNVAPGEYVVFVGKLHAEYKIVSYDNQVPIVYEVDLGETLRIEPIVVDF